METTALHLVEAGDDGDDSEDHSPPAPQCIADLRSIWRRHKRAIVVGSVAAMAGALLCLFLKPEPRLYSSGKCRRPKSQAGLLQAQVLALIWHQRHARMVG